MSNQMMWMLMICLPLVPALRLPQQDGDYQRIVPKEIILRSQSKMQEQRERLTRAAQPSYVPPDMGMFDASSKKGHASAPNNRFEAVKVELALEPPLIDHIPVELGLPEKGLLGGKNLVGLTQLKNKKDCLVYSMGVSGNSAFEEAMATVYGCEVHAFDCTITEDFASVKNKHFVFHPWCIGKDNGGLNDVHKNDGIHTHDTNKYHHVFKTLAASMKELGHTSMDLLKFDIEGFEWQLFENELLKDGNTVLPAQISFEMHTDGAKPWAVPKENTAGHGNHEVNNVFLQFHKLGYRVASKELNRHDHACAEFVMVRV